MSEGEVFPVPEAWAKKALMTAEGYAAAVARVETDPDAYWMELAGRLDWIRKPTRTKDVSFNREDFHVRWYEDGVLNVSVNCLDRHIAERGDQVAIIWEPDDGENGTTLTYRQLLAEVCRMANVLKAKGVKKGDRVTIYLPMIPQAAVAMLACARIGAVHSVIFGGFSPDSIAGRIQDCDSRIVITADEGLRGGKVIPLKRNVDEALKDCPQVGDVIVIRRTRAEVPMTAGRDVFYSDVKGTVSDQCDPEPMNAEDPLFILYTSGSTGKPKGVLHTTGGYLVWASHTHELVFDYRPGEVFWCTADVGWVTGHSYVVYGPLANGATSLIFEGVPSWPDNSRFWQVVDKHKVEIFYTAPTAIRALMRDGEGPVKSTSRASLRLIGTVGEPINPEVGILLADRDRRLPGLSPARRHGPEARVLRPPPAGREVPDRRRRRQGPGRRGQRQPLHHRLLARADADGLWRPPEVHRHLLLDLPRQVLHRGRLPPGRGRLLLDHRPGG